MSLVGTRLGPYEITATIGVGGMGEVYRATDTRLKREVALKVLPSELAADPERLARFQREAEVLASLNHPNIAHIHGFEAGQALVMELVEGPTLADRLPTDAGGSGAPLEVAEALRIGAQIADALEAAHEQGIVHRDLKPANIKVRPDGTVKVLDFGLAKALGPAEAGAGARPGLSMSPTITSPAMTQMGTILGTAAYMSPEQARGRAVDRRADIWAFGVVLFEMLSGRRLMDGDTVTDVIAAVITREPDWSRLPAGVPAAVRRLLARCLDKDPRTRLRDIGEARILLASPPADAAAAPPPATPSSGARWWIGAAMAALIVGAVIGRYALAPAAPPTERFEFEFTLPAGDVEGGSFALSPDGARLVLVIRDSGGGRRLAVRELRATDVRILPGTEGAIYPFWSPDGQEVAFFAEGQLKRITLDGAAARPVANVKNPRGGTWGPGDVMLVGSESGPILRVSAAGGKPPEPATTVNAGVEDTHAWPALLPDGNQFVFLADASNDEGHRLYLGRLDGGPSKVLRKAVRSQPVVDPDGRILLGNRGQLLAFAFDARAGTLGDDGTLLATQVATLGPQHELPASASPGGRLAYQTASTESFLVVVDSGGRVTRTIGQPGRYGNATVSPDGKRAAFEIFTDGDERVVWVQDLERGVRTPLSARGKLADSSAWSPDSQTVYFDADVNGKWEAYRMAVTGGGEPERLGLPDGATEVVVLDVSPDGRSLLGGAMFAGQRYDLYLRGLTGGAEWTPWLASPAQEDGGGFSPDSRWIAYASDASGRSEVYVASVAEGPSARRYQISSGGGVEPRFSPDGRAIYYRSPAFEWMAVDVRVDSGTIEAGVPRALFTVPSIDLPYLRNLVDVLPDGSGFLMLHPASNAPRAIKVRTRH